MQCSSVLIFIGNRPPLFAKKFKSYAKNELFFCSRNTVTTLRSFLQTIFCLFKRISVYLNEYEVVAVQCYENAKMCSTSERYSKNIGAIIDQAAETKN